MDIADIDIAIVIMPRIETKKSTIFLYVNKKDGDRPLTNDDVIMTYNFQFDSAPFFDEDQHIAEANGQGVFLFHVPVSSELTIFFDYNINTFTGSVLIDTPTDWGSYNLNDLIQKQYGPTLGWGTNWPYVGFNGIFWDCYSRVPGQRNLTDWIASGVDPN